MSTSDCRTLHIYRLPINQKRVLSNENHLSTPHARSPSPSRSVSTSGRRHSTPPAATKYLVDINSTPPNTFVKYFHSHPRATSANRETNHVSEPSRPVSLVKLRHQDERLGRVVTTPTSVKSFTDVVLPIAKKNRNNIVETTTSSILSDIQSISRNVPTTKRGQVTSLNFNRDAFVSDEDSRDKSFRDETSKLNSVRWFHARFPCRFLHCNLCHWYCSCPFWCWIACVLLALALLIGLFLSMRFLAD